MYYDINLEKGLQDNNPYLEEEELFEILEAIKIDVLERSSCKNPNLGTNSLLMQRFVLTVLKINPKILQGVFKRLFDTNSIKYSLSAFDGPLGKLNARDRNRRQRRFDDKMRNGHRSKSDNVVVLAEGDSWFQFPRIVKLYDPITDIVDWLMKDRRYAVYSLAAGGDWFSNILRAGEYVEELPKVDPDVFLISGGGNDLAGARRIALMVRNPGENDSGLRNKDDGTIVKLMNRRQQSFENRKEDRSEEDPFTFDPDKYERGLRFLSDEFFKFINIYFVQYFVFLFGLAKNKRYENMLILTQGYDFALPHDGSRAFPISLRRIVNVFAGTGNWLAKPLCMKGITNKYDQEAIMYAMITEFNEMLIQLARSPLLPNVFHIDCRGVAEGPDDWYDEIHLKSRGYMCISKAIRDCIRDNRVSVGKMQKQKVYPARLYKI
ncbi:MAG: SGNH/GDSL hydrolase family protein [Bacteroidota bacterium]